DLDVLPRECTRNAEAERLSDRLLAGETSRVRLGRIRTGVAVRALGFREAPLAEAWIAIERLPNPRNLDEISSDLQAFSSNQSGTCAIEDTIASGRTRPRSTAS